MARTNVPLTELDLNTATVQPAGVALDPTNDHVIAGVFPDDISSHEGVIVDIDSTFAGAKVFEFIRRDGTKLTVSLNAQRAKVPLSSDFKQSDGSVLVDVPAAATGTIRAYSLSKHIS